MFSWVNISNAFYRICLHLFRYTYIHILHTYISTHFSAFCSAVYTVPFVAYIFVITAVIHYSVSQFKVEFMIRRCVPASFGILSQFLHSCVASRQLPSLVACPVPSTVPLFPSVLLCPYCTVSSRTILYTLLPFPFRLVSACSAFCWIVLSPARFPTHTHTYLWIFLYVCVCVHAYMCKCIFASGVRMVCVWCVWCVWRVWRVCCCWC